MRRRLVLAVAAGLVMAPALTTMPVASASQTLDQTTASTGSTDGDLGGGGITSPDDAVPDSPQAVAKSALAEAWLAATGITAPGAAAPQSTTSGQSAAALRQTYADLVADYEATYHTQAPIPAPEEDTADRSASGTATAGAVMVPMGAPPKAKTLAVTWKQQKKGYYCGPATGVMISSYEGRATAYGKTLSLTQKHMARKGYMRTEANGATPESLTNGHYYMARGLNKWASGTENGFYVATAIASTTGLETKFLYSISADHPFAVSTIELQNGSHYNSHPNRLIGHWITGIGYTKNGAKLKLADPASGLSNGYQSSEQKFKITATTMFPHTEGRHLVW